MKYFFQILTFLCGLVTAAHFLRFGNAWEALAIFLFTLATCKSYLVPRPILFLAALGAGFFWTHETITLVQLRITMDLPWIRLVVILSAVCLAHFSLALLILGRTGEKSIGVINGRTWVRTIVFLLSGGILFFITQKAPLPILLGVRFFPESGLFWITLFALYGGVIANLLLSPQAAQTRSLMWSFFSLVFFGQLLLGLAGFDQLLMTGNLHLPVPALIIAGPLFRGTGFFMPILVGVTLILVGSAWCSHLCYIGAWDDRLARLGPGKPQPLPVWAPKARLLILLGTLLIPLMLRFLDIPWTIALTLAMVFGVVGVAIMVFWSRRTGTMTHCTLWCPIGLLNNLVGRLMPWRIRISPQCTGCGLCTRACRYNALTPLNLAQKKPGLTCSLCGDCLPRCPHGHLGYYFPGLSSLAARSVFVVLVSTLHTIFLAVARI